MGYKRNTHGSLILASASPRRRDLLRKAGYKIRVCPSRTNENHPSNLTPGKLVMHLALKKAISIATRYPQSLVLGADTMVFIGHQRIGKPRNHRHAKKILKLLSGRWQRVMTGVALVWKGGTKRKVGFAVSRVKLRSLSTSDIEHACRHHLDKAGAYAVQQKNDPFVVKLTGDYDNVVGLPIRVVKRLLRFT